MNVLKKKKSIAFDELFEWDFAKLEIIVKFIALLELLRLKAVKAHQENPFGKTLINFGGWKC